MHLLFALSLRVLHFIYALVIHVRSYWKRYTWSPPQPLSAARKRLPKHLAIILVADTQLAEEATEKLLSDSVVNAVGWCRASGIQKLTIYEENGLLSASAQTIGDRLPHNSSGSESSDSELEYPLTPPPSDYSESRPLSPSQSIHSAIPAIRIQVSKSPLEYDRKRSVKRRKHSATPSTQKPPLSLCLISRESSKAAIASTASSLARFHQQQTYNGAIRPKDLFKLSVDTFEHLLEGDDGLCPPDFMIVHCLNPFQRHQSPLELHGFPPWHIRLTEIHQTNTRQRRLFLSAVPHGQITGVLDELSFREALDEFARAEMRFGK
jgi:dehydrodolichyl diphosphate syntase complex subunit NUS1